MVDFATVYLKGTNQGCYTDEKGIYHLKTTAGEYTLVVSAIGYQTVEKKVKLARKTKKYLLLISFLLYNLFIVLKAMQR